MKMPKEELHGTWERCIENALSVKTTVEDELEKPRLANVSPFDDSLHSNSPCLSDGECQTDVRLRAVHQRVRSTLPEGREAHSTLESEEIAGWSTIKSREAVVFQLSAGFHNLIVVVYSWYCFVYVLFHRFLSLQDRFDVQQ